MYKSQSSLEFHFDSKIERTFRRRRMFSRTKINHHLEQLEENFSANNKKEDGFGYHHWHCEWHRQMHQRICCVWSKLSSIKRSETWYHCNSVWIQTNDVLNVTSICLFWGRACLWRMSRKQANKAYNPYSNT